MRRCARAVVIANQLLVGAAAGDRTGAQARDRPELLQIRISAALRASAQLCHRTAVRVSSARSAWGFVCGPLNCNNPSERSLNILLPSVLWQWRNQLARC
jgi:hypothetical protein